MNDAIPLGKPLDEKTDADKKISAAPRVEPALPAEDCDVLIGMAKIGRWLGISEGAATTLANAGTIATFTAPNHRARCALKSELNATYREYRHRPDATAKSPARKPKTPK